MLTEQRLATIGFLYTQIVKPFFFLFDAEVAHNRCTAIGKFLGQTWLSRWLTALLFGYTAKNSMIIRDGISFPGRVGLAAGFDYNAELIRILPSLGFSFHTIGTVTLLPYAGNPKPRLGRLLASKALLVNKGLKTIGARAISAKLKRQAMTIPVGISIANTNRKFSSTCEQIVEILACFRLFESAPLHHSYYELNISCPNTFGSEPFTTPKRLNLLLTCLDKLHILKPIYIKMPIDQSAQDSLQLFTVIKKHAVSGIIVGNLTKDHQNPLVTTQDSNYWNQHQGNLSGKPTWQRSNTLIILARKFFGTDFTIIGTGGVFSPEEAAYKLKIGADLVQLITGMIFEGPQLIAEINYYLDQQKLQWR